MALGRQHLSRRSTIAVLAACAIVAIAIGVPLLVHDRASRPLATAPFTPTVSAPAGTRVADRIGSAVELVARRGSAVAHAAVDAPQRVASADQSFGLALLKKVAGTTRGNVSVSPMSLALALTMLQNGARGQTLAGITAALHATGLSAATLDAGWAALVREWTAAAQSGGFALQSADSLWLQQGLRTDPAFLSALKTYFDSGVWQTDFRSPGAVAAINAWTSRQTRGRIPKLFDNLDSSTLAVIANAVYFKAAWQQPFDPNDTQPGTFTSGDGTSSQVPFMVELGTLRAAVTSGYDAVQLPYRGGRFAALAIMPTSGSLDTFVQRLDGTALQQVVSGLDSSRVQVALPTFSTSSSLDLVPTLRSMGMSAAFGASADFSALSPAGLQVGQVVQRVYLKVAEQGTEAAAATGIGMRATAAEAVSRTIRFDHPFLFLIRDTKTGALLFESQLQHPQT